MNEPSTEPARPWFRSASGWAWIGFAGIAVFLLFTEHRAHLFGALPFVLLLLCLLLHLFHHGGHGGHGSHIPGGKEERGNATTTHHHADGVSDR